jgi:hypothetical protein
MPIITEDFVVLTLKAKDDVHIYVKILKNIITFAGMVFDSIREATKYSIT